MRRLMAHRDARVYLAGQALSTFGDNALWLAIAIWTKMLTGSNSAAGLVFFAFISGSSLAPAAGVLADRVRRRPLLVVTNLATAALVCTLLLAGGRSGVWLIYLVMFGYGAASSLITSAQTALLAVMIPADLLGEANSVLGMASQGLRVVTPLAGAGLLAWLGPAPVIILDAATFVAAAAAVWVLRLREPAPGRPQAHWRAEFTAGIRHIMATPVLRRLLITCVMALLVFGFFETVDFAVVGQGLHRAPTFLGVLATSQGIGALAGGLAAGQIMRRVGERVLVTMGLLAGVLCCALLTTGWLLPVLIASGLLGVCVIWVVVGINTLIQRLTPAGLLGRVDAALSVAATVPQAASIALGAALVAVVSFRVLLLVMAVVITLSAVYLGWPYRREAVAPVSAPVSREAG